MRARGLLYSSSRRQQETRLGGAAMDVYARMATESDARSRDIGLRFGSETPSAFPSVPRRPRAGGRTQATVALLSSSCKRYSLACFFWRKNSHPAPPILSTLILVMAEYKSPSLSVLSSTAAPASSPIHTRSISAVAYCIPTTCTIQAASSPNLLQINQSMRLAYIPHFNFTVILA